jgi:aminocarboxymuconate-semialdehyde decarboxylase
MQDEVIDVHAHIVPESLLTESSFRRTDNGWVFAAPGVGDTRPIGPRMTNVDLRRSWQAETGITRQILSPWLDAQTGNRDWMSRVNDAMCESAAALGTVALASVDTTDLDRAASDLADAMKLPEFAGLMLSTDLALQEFDPLWTVAAEQQIPVMLHPSTCGPYGALGNVHGRLIDNTLALSNLILHGVLDRFPGLRLIAVHGGGFLPYQAHRLDGGYRTGETHHGELERMPSAYLQDLYFDTVALSSQAIQFLTEVTAPDHVLLGSDYPFPIGDPQPARTVLAATIPWTTTLSVLNGAANTLFGGVG